MKLALEISLALGLAFVVVLLGAITIGVERELRLVEVDLRRDHVVLGAQLASAVDRVWRVAGTEAALALLTASGEDGVGARWRWLDEPDTAQPSLSGQDAARLQRGEPVSLSFDGKDGVEIRQTLVPLRSPDGRLGAIELRERLLQEDLWGRGVVAQAAWTIAAAVTVSGTLAIALGVFLVGKPIRLLVEKARRIGAGDLTGEIVLPRRNELGELAREMNAMGRNLAATRERAEREATERIHALEQLRHADRLTTIGKLASGIGHELGTPLAIVTGRAELILDGYPEGSAAHENAAIVLDQVRKMTAIMRQFMDFARRRRAERARHDVRGFLEQTLGLLSTFADRRSVSLEVEGNDRVEWDFDAFLIQQAVTNLLMNGIQATPAGKSLVVGYQVRNGDAEEPLLHLYVKDQGAGMSPEVLEKAFEPFFTTKEIGEGTGLGLSIAQGIVRDHGGWIDVESALEEGSRFSIWLPRGE